MYFDTAFLIQTWVYCVVILRACMVAVLAISASVLNHVCRSGSWIGGGGDDDMGMGVECIYYWVGLPVWCIFLICRLLF